MLAHLRRKALKIPTQDWFRNAAPKTLPRLHRWLAQVSGGRFHPGATILLTSTGAKSGQRRQTPLEAVPQEHGRWLLVASNFAQAHHPAWSFNLLAHPDEVEIMRHGKVTAMTSRLLEGAEREHAWQVAQAHMPVWEDYIEITDRPFRIFELKPKN